MKSSRLLPLDLIRLKANNQRFTMLTAYDAPMASLLEKSGIKVVLVGDSLGNNFSGFDNTIPVTLEQMIYHCQAVSRGCSQALIIADMPFMTAQVSITDAKKNAAKLIQKGGAQAVKIEIFSPQDLDVIRAIIDCGIPVLGHLGLTPQSLYQLGGYAKQAKDKRSQRLLEKQADALSDAGCFGLLLECIPDDFAQHLQKKYPIPIIGIGSGSHCDGQVLVTQDLLGMNESAPPSFVKPYAQLYSLMSQAIKDFKKDSETL